MEARARDATARGERRGASGERGLMVGEAGGENCGQEQWITRRILNRRITTVTGLTKEKE